jgi:hypothetical protein
MPSVKNVVRNGPANARIQSLAYASFLMKKLHFELLKLSFYEYGPNQSLTTGSNDLRVHWDVRARISELVERGRCVGSSTSTRAVQLASGRDAESRPAGPLHVPVAFHPGPPSATAP